MRRKKSEKWFLVMNFSLPLSYAFQMNFSAVKKTIDRLLLLQTRSNTKKLLFIKSFTISSVKQVLLMKQFCETICTLFKNEPMNQQTVQCVTVFEQMRPILLNIAYLLVFYSSFPKFIHIPTNVEYICIYVINHDFLFSLGIEKIKFIVKYTFLRPHKF